MRYKVQGRKNLDQTLRNKFSYDARSQKLIKKVAGVGDERVSFTLCISPKKHFISTADKLFRQIENNIQSS